MQNIPKTTKGVVIHADGTAKYGDLTLPEIADDQVLIKVHSAPINPSDQLCVTGAYADSRPRPCTLGGEGSGLVVATGSSDKAKSLLNKRVSFFTGRNTEHRNLGRVLCDLRSGRHPSSRPY